MFVFLSKRIKTYSIQRCRYGISKYYFADIKNISLLRNVLHHLSVLSVNYVIVK